MLHELLYCMLYCILCLCNRHFLFFLTRLVLTTNSVANNSTTTAIFLQINATGTTTGGSIKYICFSVVQSNLLSVSACHSTFYTFIKCVFTFCLICSETKKPSSTSEVNTTPITTATPLVTDFVNATNGGLTKKGFVFLIKVLYFLFLFFKVQ